MQTDRLETSDHKTWECASDTSELSESRLEGQSNVLGAPRTLIAELGDSLSHSLSLSLTSPFINHDFDSDSNSNPNVTENDFFFSVDSKYGSLECYVTCRSDPLPSRSIKLNCDQEAR